MLKELKRRRFLGAVSAAVGGSALGTGSSAGQTFETTNQTLDTTSQTLATSALFGGCMLDSVGTLVFNETSSLLDAGYGRLTDDDIVFVFSDETASAGRYRSGPVPLWARDREYFGSGSLLVNDAEDNCLDYGQDSVLLNIIDSYTGGSGHIVYDESAAQDYTLADNFSKFDQWVSGEGYTIESSTDLTASLDGADALLVTLPGEEHAADQLAAIESFVAAGNPVFLFNEADSSSTDNLNYLADQLDLAFRFDDDEVTDGPGWGNDDWPVTRNYDDETYPEWFDYRTSMGFDPGEEYQAKISRVIDGDTFVVEHVGGYHDGEEDTIRHLGTDTAETWPVSNETNEWRGIEDLNHLDDWGEKATDYAKANFSEGDIITFWVDENEFPPRGNYGRLVAFHTYPEGHSQAGESYNFDIVKKGYAKPYNSSFVDHPDYVDAYWDAYENDRGIWEGADGDATDKIWNRDVDTLRFRGATSIDARFGSPDEDEVAVWSERGDPLVAVDEDNRVALVGGLMNADEWEGVGDENFVFNANLAQQLSDVADQDMLLIEGGHGQFDASYDFSFEGKEAYHRFIEGLDGMWFQAVNELDGNWLDTRQGRHALVITPPAPDTCYTTREVNALQGFLAQGGAIVLKANTEVDPRSVEMLNDLASDLGTDLRFDDDDVGDVETSNFNDSFALFEAYDSDNNDPGQEPHPDVSIDVRTDPATDVEETTATLAGELTDFEEADDVTVWFEYGSIGSGFPESTGSSSFGSPLALESNVSGLSEGTEYEYRIVGQALGLRETGGVQTFTTAGDSSSSGDGWCFITTATARDDATLNSLRRFRDDSMGATLLGRGLVGLYYRISPPVARTLERHPESRAFRATRRIIEACATMSDRQAETDSPIKSASIGTAVTGLYIAGTMVGASGHVAIRAREMLSRD